jgi:hypothetical protein
VLVPAPQPTQLADPGQRELAYAELQRIDLQLDDLRRRHVGIGAPISLMAVGYGALAIGAIVALASYSNAEDIQHHRIDRDYHSYDANGDGVVDGKDEHRYRHVSHAFTAVAAVGLAVGVASTIWLIRRVASRKAEAAERRQLLDQRERLRKQLDYGLSVLPQQTQFSIQGQF